MTDIVKKARKYCTKLLKGSRCNGLPFHSPEHTVEVYDNVLKIGVYERLSVEELEPALLAALFHDTGNAEDFKQHENFSISHALHFLNKNNYSHSNNGLVIDCINATRMPQNPITILEKIICDADLYHLGTTNFQTKNTLLRKEWSTFMGVDYSDDEWIEMNIKFLKSHQYLTKYGRNILEPIKQENLKALQIKLYELRKE